MQATKAWDRRGSGFDARFHSTSPQATPRDYRVLPARIILVRHGESEGNVDNITYAQVRGWVVPSDVDLRGTEKMRPQCCVVFAGSFSRL